MTLGNPAAPRLRRTSLALCILAAPALAACSGESDVPPVPTDGSTAGTGSSGEGGGASAEQAALKQLVLPVGWVAPADVTNKYADDPRAAALGRRLFFDTRFSGPLLDSANDGTAGTLGNQGDTQKVACASCHSTSSRAFVDDRSSRGQLSLASGWTHRKAPSLLDLHETKFFFWDGRRGTAYSQVFGPIESPLEFNSSRLFVAQQMATLYKADYEAIFGPLPSLDEYAPLAPSQAGCTAPPAGAADATCAVPGADDDDVTRVVVNFGKAVQAFTRQLTCGRSRFDRWVEGDSSALSADEQAGARLFVGKAACHRCHSGPYLSDHSFHNLGVGGDQVFFTPVNTKDDPGASVGFEALKKDPLNSLGKFSDGDDGRLGMIPADTAAALGAFKTPTLRCVSRRRAFMHNGRWRSLEDVIRFFSDGPSPSGYVGTAEISPLHLNDVEQAQLKAFLLALDGEGPDPTLLTPPESK